MPQMYGQETPLAPSQHMHLRDGSRARVRHCSSGAPVTASQTALFAAESGENGAASNKQNRRFSTPRKSDVTLSPSSKTLHFDMPLPDEPAK